ncbi:hypothetical protein [Helicobacter ganmani]|uniref:hypothetical protein n=1 Tax=Helicobacter ganmani TaxID=60246 RepID=UPI003A87C6F9
MTTTDIIIDIALKVAAVIFSVIIAAIFSFIKRIKNDKIRNVAEKIAKTVEQIYIDATSDEKIKAFKDLCAAEKIDVKKAVAYLEDHIIPMSKSINAVPDLEKKDATKEKNIDSEAV